MSSCPTLAPDQGKHLCAQAAGPGVQWEHRACLHSWQLPLGGHLEGQTSLCQQAEESWGLGQGDFYSIDFPDHRQSLEVWWLLPGVAGKLISGMLLPLQPKGHLALLSSGLSGDSLFPRCLDN